MQDQNRRDRDRGFPILGEPEALPTTATTELNGLKIPERPKIVPRRPPNPFEIAMRAISGYTPGWLANQADVDAGLAQGRPVYTCAECGVKGFEPKFLCDPVEGE